MSNRDRVEDFVNKFRDRAREQWNAYKLPIHGTRRVGQSPVMTFYHAAVCGGARPAAPGGPAIPPNPWVPVAPAVAPTAAPADESIRQFLYYAWRWGESKNLDDFKKELTGDKVFQQFDIDKRAKFEADYGGRAGADREFARIRPWSERVRSAGNPADLVKELLRQFDERLLPHRSGPGAALIATADPDDSAWGEIFRRIEGDDWRTKNWCSPIYCYWLDEAGLPWTLERLADRVENGIVRTTLPLRNVRVPEGSDAASVVHDFAVSWQKGDLASVDERRKLYAALYGFPLHAAARWGTFETVDPRHAFPLAFHRFLSEAMRFYTEQRNRLVVPDPQSAKMAFDDMSRALAEGNENLRRNVGPELRAQMEYTIACLGGDGAIPNTTVVDHYPDLVRDWTSTLSVRPGMRTMNRPWELVCDAVRDLYGWQRPGTPDYRTLAECSELLLVTARVVSGNNQSISDDQWRALLLALQGVITTYVQAYKAVARVDLERQPVYGPPALALAQAYAPPVVPPLRRLWADVPASV